MVTLTDEIRKEADKFDNMLSELFDQYVIEPNKGNQIELKIENTLIQMSAYVSRDCYAVYAEIYQSVKSTLEESDG